MPPNRSTNGPLHPALATAWRSVAEQFLDMRSRWFEAAGAVVLSPAGLDALLKIDPDTPPSMRELAEHLGCDASYVTAMVDDLEHAEYAERRPSARDRRIKQVVLTERGRRARQTAQEHLTAPPAGLRTLSASRQRALADLLHQALSAAD